MRLLEHNDAYLFPSGVWQRVLSRQRLSPHALLLRGRQSDEPGPCCCRAAAACLFVTLTCKNTRRPSAALAGRVASAHPSELFPQALQGNDVLINLNDRRAHSLPVHISVGKEQHCDEKGQRHTSLEEKQMSVQLGGPGLPRWPPHRGVGCLTRDGHDETGGHWAREVRRLLAGDH
ncbi:hypothetical protein AAFF_G00258460 [Aldrovandia affinis]|uniref:Uncharacterized protein n=1 Tax=Aldrovandia affinis TaxID=143900 RepID=A0AAD7WT89_9TELE|nr:hypothetical protein AAFF_G00258460 [Aldrovandia affinis]